jgi:benzodiazapine receptor
MWTLLYGLMGYAAHRAWTTGMGSFDAKKVLLTKVYHKSFPQEVKPSY